MAVKGGVFLFFAKRQQHTSLYKSTGASGAELSKYAHGRKQDEAKFDCGIVVPIASSSCLSQNTISRARRSEHKTRHLLEHGNSV